MKLWIFGDSFSDLKTGEDFDRNDIWSSRLVKLLSVDGAIIRAKYGVSNEWIYNQLVEASQFINRTDYIIVQLTDPSRHWFLDDPTFSNLTTLSSLKDSELEKLNISVEQRQAARHYLTHLYRENTDDILYHQTFHAICHVINVAGFLNVGIIPGFSPLPGVKRTLVDVCNNEFVSERDRHQWYSTHPVDLRINHLSPENHLILADKLKDFLLHPGTELDLSSGFKTNFLRYNDR